MTHNYQKADVVDVDLGEVVGHEQAKHRPCVIIKSFNQLGLAAIVPFTSKAPNARIFTMVKIEKRKAGLLSDSYALCHQIRTVSFERITSKKGVLDRGDFLKIQNVLLDALEL